MFNLIKFAERPSGIIIIPLFNTLKVKLMFTFCYGIDFIAQAYDTDRFSII